KDLAFGKLLQLAPVVAGRLLGNGSAPSEAPSPSPLTILIGELATSLTPEQIAHIGSALSQNQQILFVEAMREAMRANSDGNPAGPAPAPGAASAGTNGAQAH